MAFGTNGLVIQWIESPIHSIVNTVPPPHPLHRPIAWDLHITFAPFHLAPSRSRTPYLLDTERDREARHTRSQDPSPFQQNVTHSYIIYIYICSQIWTKKLKPKSNGISITRPWLWKSRRARVHGKFVTCAVENGISIPSTCALFGNNYFAHPHVLEQR